MVIGDEPLVRRWAREEPQPQTQRADVRRLALMLRFHMCDSFHVLTVQRAGTLEPLRCRCEEGTSDGQGESDSDRASEYWRRISKTKTAILLWPAEKPAERTCRHDPLAYRDTTTTLSHKSAFAIMIICVTHSHKLRTEGVVLIGYTIQEDFEGRSVRDSELGCGDRTSSVYTVVIPCAQAPTRCKPLLPVCLGALPLEPDQ
ncbi:hypothetical protein LXA43DRAFT_1012778 [Ganoderma leucocontextum]|nr:hypothetical protein LXA43DRAFT_1012778 [Ganoderma leucocontextum]